MTINDNPFVNFFKRKNKIQQPPEKVVDELIKDPVSNETLVKNLPAGRVSKSEYDNGGIYNSNYCKPTFLLELIPKLRALSRSNEDLGSVYNDLIQLTNTGHNIIFNQDIPEEQVDKMRKHLISKRKKWGSGVHGIEGLVNKWIAQVWISGALSNEWVINNTMDGILNSCLVNPENINFKYDSRTTFYQPYQRITNNSNL